MDPIMVKLLARYVASFPEKHSSVLAAWQAIPAYPGAKIDLRVLCHKLAGSAPMYEFAALGSAARAVVNGIDENAEAKVLAGTVSAVLEQLSRDSENVHA